MNARTFLVLLALGTGLVTPAAAAEPVPMHTTPSGHRAVEVTIRGEGPWPFVVDTGASHTAIAQPLAEHFGFVSSFERTDDVQALTSRFRAERFIVEQVHFGPVEVDRLDAVVVPIAPDASLSAYGLLGADVFGAGRVSIDFAQGRLDLAPPPVRHADARIDPTTGLIFATARIAGVNSPVQVLVDSGSAQTIVNPALARRLYGRGFVLSVRVGGVGGDDVPSNITTLERLRVGGLCQTRVIALRADLDIFRALGWDGEPAMVLGLDVLGSGRVIIDRQAGIVELAPGPAGRGCRSGRVQRDAS